MKLGASGLVAATALLLTSLLLTSACTGDKPAAARPVTGGPEPKTIEGARAAAQTVFDRFAGGDFAGAWDMYSAAGKQAISQEDYVRLNQACARRGLAIQLSSARMDGADRAVVIAKQLMAAQSYTMVYEDGGWKLAPAREGLALYRMGAARAIAAQKKAGTCAGR